MSGSLNLINPGWWQYFKSSFEDDVRYAPVDLSPKALERYLTKDKQLAELVKKEFNKNESKLTRSDVSVVVQYLEENWDIRSGKADKLIPAEELFTNPDKTLVHFASEEQIKKIVKEVLAEEKGKLGDVHLKDLKLVTPEQVV